MPQLVDSSHPSGSVSAPSLTPGSSGPPPCIKTLAPPVLDSLSPWSNLQPPHPIPPSPRDHLHRLLGLPLSWSLRRRWSRSKGDPDDDPEDAVPTTTIATPLHHCRAIVSTGAASWAIGISLRVGSPARPISRPPRCTARPGTGVRQTVRSFLPASRQPSSHRRQEQSVLHYSESLWVGIEITLCITTRLSFEDQSWIGNRAQHLVDVSINSSLYYSTCPVGKLRQTAM